MIWFKKYVLLIGCLYADGSRTVWEIHRGSLESCEKLQRTMSAVSIDGPMPVKAETIVVAAAKFDEVRRKVMALKN